MRPGALALALLALSGQGLVDRTRAEEAAPRQISPDRFAPSPRGLAPEAPKRAAIVMPTRERPLGDCERGTRDWLSCLDATARLSDTGLDDEEDRLIERLDRRVRLNAVLKASVAKSIKGIGNDWRALRERECGELALIERDMAGVLYEARLLCQIRRNVERVEALRARYGDGP